MPHWAPNTGPAGPILAVLPYRVGGETSFRPNPPQIVKWYRAAQVHRLRLVFGRGLVHAREVVAAVKPQFGQLAGVGRLRTCAGMGRTPPCQGHGTAPSRTHTPGLPSQRLGCGDRIHGTGTFEALARSCFCEP